MKKAIIKNDCVLFNRKLYAVSAYPRFSKETNVYVKLSKDNHTLAVYDLNKKLICKTKHIYYPYDLNFEYVDSEKVLCVVQPECIHDYVALSDAHHFQSA